MKKYLVYLILLISAIMFTSKVNALDVENKVFEFEYLNHSYWDFSTTIDNYCSNYDSYIIHNQNTANGPNIPFSTSDFPNYFNIHFTCFNKSDFKLSGANNKFVLWNNGNIGFTSSNNMYNTQLQYVYSKQNFNQYYNADTLFMIKEGNVPFENKQLTLYDFHSKTNKTGNYENLTNYPVLFDNNNIDQNMKYYLPIYSILYTNIDEDIYICPTSKNNCNENNITLLYSSYHDPEISYIITDGTDKGKKLTINFNYFNASDKIYVHNFYTGTTEEYIYAAIAGMGNKLEYDNLNVDTVFQVEAFTENDEFIMSENIDIALSLIDKMKDRYIRIYYDSLKNIYLGNYFNFKDTDKCYYKISNENAEEIGCNDSFIFDERDSNLNSYFKLYINDNNNNLVAEKIVNFYFNNNLPQIHFDSYFDSEENKQVVEINIDKYQTGDLVYYSLDNQTWVQLESKNKNKLDFYTDSNLYVKVERNNNVVSNAYFKVLYKAFERSEYDDDREGFAGIVSNFRDFLDAISMTALGYGKTVYNLLVNSKLNIYILFIFVSSILIMILKSIKR